MSNEQPKRAVVSHDRIVIADLETAGLEQGEEEYDGRWAKVLEVAMLECDRETLDPLARFTVPVLHEDGPGPLLDLVQDMHAKTGLWDRIQAFGVAPDEAWGYARSWLVERGYGDGLTEDPYGNVPPLAVMVGNGVDRFDRRFSKHFSLAFDNTFHYRSLDVSSVMWAFEFAGHNSGATRDYDPDLTEHVALDDCEQARRNWKRVRQTIREGAQALDQLRTHAAAQGSD